MADFFRQNGVEAVAVHSGPGSAPRTGSIERLRVGDLQVIFTVDMFNEGLDVPEIDAVLMLRPTESPIVFLQQLGRGLRRSDGKDALTVIDFIGNHRSFLIKPRTLLGLGAGRQQPGTSKVLRAMRTGDFGLPPGCSAVFDVRLVEVLSAIARVGARSVLEDYCLSYADERGSRPTALQVFEAGYNPASAQSRHGHWFGFLDEIGLLDADEREVVNRYGDVLAGIEKDGGHQVVQAGDPEGLAADRQAALWSGRRRDRMDRAPDRRRRSAFAGRHQIGEGEARPGVHDG